MRVCRECGEEFRPVATVCSDCGGALEDRNDDEAGTPSSAATPAPLAPPRLSREDLVAVASGSEAADIEGAARLLGEAGVPFAVSGAVHQFRLLVEPDQLERARGALALDAAPVADETPGVCPACETALPPSAAECPECGLAFAAAEAPASGNRRDRGDVFGE